MINTIYNSFTQFYLAFMHNYLTLMMNQILEQNTVGSNSK